MASKKYSLGKLNNDIREIYNIGLLPDKYKKYKDCIIKKIQTLSTFSEQYVYLSNEYTKKEYILDGEVYSPQYIKDFIKHQINYVIMKCNDINNKCITEIDVEEENRLYISNYNVHLDYLQYKGIVILLGDDEIRELITTQHVRQLLKKDVLRINVADSNDGTNLTTSNLHTIADYVDKMIKKGDVLIHCRAGLSRGIIAACAFIYKYKQELITDECTSEDNTLTKVNATIEYVQKFRPTLVRLPMFTLLLDYISTLQKSLACASFACVSKQPIEQSISKPIEQPINQPIEPSVSKPIEQPINHPIEPSVSKPIEQSINQPIEPSVSKPIEQSINQPIEPSVEQPIK